MFHSTLCSLYDTVQNKGVHCWHFLSENNTGDTRNHSSCDCQKIQKGAESSWRESLFNVQFGDLCWLRHQASTLYIKVNLTCDTLRINPNPLKSSIEKELKSEELSFSCIRYFWRLGLRKKIYYLHYRRFYMPSWFN